MNNNGIYNAALQGASGGVQTQRWLSDTSAASYVDIQGQLVTFATAVDNAIGADSSLTDGDFELMQSICQGVVSGRFLQNQTAGNLALSAQAIAAFWTQLKGGLQPVFPGQRNLGTVLYVDHSIAVGGNGNIENPFKTIQQAVTAAVALGIFTTIYVAPGNYGSAAIDCTGFVGSIVGMTGLEGVDAVGPIDTDGILILDNLSVIGNITVTGAVPLFLHNVQVTGNIGGNVLAAVSDNDTTNALVTGTVTLTSSATFINYSIGGVLTAAGFFAFNSSFADIISHGNLTANGCDLQNVTIDAATLAELNNCTIQAAATFTGGNADTSIFALDAITNQSFIVSGVTLTTAHQSVFGRLASDTLAFIVAGIAAGGTAYFDAAIPTTSVLHGLAQGDPIAVNPIADLVGAGANAGFLASYRVSAANTVRICLRGNIPDATYNFVVTRL